MRRAACISACGLCVCGAVSQASVSSGTYQPQPFDHYQPILDRMPFGDAVPAPVAQAVDAATAQTEAQVQAEQQKLAQQVNMSCVNVTPDGTTAIGFTDLAAKPPVNYYLLTGASAGGWTVVDADYDEEWAQIKKDDVTITLKLGKGLIDAPPARAPALAIQTPAAALSTREAASGSGSDSLPPGLVRRPSLGGRSIPGLTSLQKTGAEPEQIREDLTKLRQEGGDLKSYMERLRERKQLESAEKAAIEQSSRDKLQELARKITQEELARKDRENELNLIEPGPTPLSNTGHPTSTEETPQTENRTLPQ